MTKNKHTKRAAAAKPLPRETFTDGEIQVTTKAGAFADAVDVVYVDESVRITRTVVKLGRFSAAPPHPRPA